MLSSKLVPALGRVHRLSRVYKKLVHPCDIIRSVGGNLLRRQLSASSAANNQLKMSTKDYVLSNDVPFSEVDCSEAFAALNDAEKKYAHHLSQAAWDGELIILLQTSPESPALFELFYNIFSEHSLSDFKEEALKHVSNDDYTAFLVYAATFLWNSGNYKGFGDTKFLPNLPIEKFEAIIKSSPKYRLQPVHIDTLWNACKNYVYSLTEREKSLGFSESGITTYFSSNCTEEDGKLITDFLKENRMDGYNCRTFKTVNADGKPVYEIRLASVDSGFDASFMLGEKDFRNSKVVVTRGDYSPILAQVCKHLEAAKEFAANSNEKNMLEKYVSSFKTGKLEDHKDGSRFWIRDKGPVVETYIGFIENYRDPAGVRAEFEGFVAVVNKEMSKKYQVLVDSAETFLEKLPWDKNFEKDKFLKPDFTSLDVLTFGSSGVPSGINIPNYDEIRQDEGFKNVTLGNVVPAQLVSKKLVFLKAEDDELLNKNIVKAFEVVVALHELLGHGSGKLLMKNKDGSFNFDSSVINPLTNKPIDSWYNDGETYDTVFQKLSSPYEECRAESVALYLSLENEVMKIFNHEGADAETILYAVWLDMAYKGVKALEFYQPSTGLWMQSHAQARYVIARVLVEAGEGLFTVKETEAGENLLVSLDSSKIRTVGKKAMGNFLRKMQVYKSTADIAKAKEMFDGYSAVTNSGDYKWAAWRDIVMKFKQPRKVLVMSNTFIEGDKVVLKRYKPSAEGMIESYIDRFKNSSLHAKLIELAEKDEKHFKISS
ncbi:dipeptidyl peptidase 3 isoform X1 [Nilaparvata lugens]|uniref:dipeptidyl peptidase 3 isoform X1 n=2 Tax=Nilaparvata lugens TaxID=108931 RepID=UPI00193E9B57|nr:dipeptidyl peptidase 3 isoform X1 [Nilaparvata lugens]